MGGSPTQGAGWLRVYWGVLLRRFRCPQTLGGGLLSAGVRWDRFSVKGYELWADRIRTGFTAKEGRRGVTERVYVTCYGFATKAGIAYGVYRI